ncbi:hypothetical protein LU290_03235 [Moraxella nasibovis]|uniref:hypothetical protein n=1 Tax=Moraxella nasibovis TaxID=2904120 RepID=UPI00240F8448|nr:hypothetical protein [Moraxella nasibovis]WFF39249.1 hypothetical protein LU290_03235 [Moraxella nasibovis]
MTDFNFKEGDKVYYPTVSNKALTLRASVGSGPYIVGLVWGGIGDKDSFTADGKRYHTDPNPSIFPATQEWYDKLVHVYPDLENPPTQKGAIDIILAMIEADWGYIPCRVSDDEDDFDYVDLINSIILTSTASYVGSKEWKFAVPFDPQTNKNIIDFVNGEIVLED